MCTDGLQLSCRQSKLIGCMSFGVKSLLTLDKVPPSGVLCVGMS